jgi:hypothetical protein
VGLEEPYHATFISQWASNFIRAKITKMATRFRSHMLLWATLFCSPDANCGNLIDQQPRRDDALKTMNRLRFGKGADKFVIIHWLTPPDNVLKYPAAPSGASAGSDYLGAKQPS